MEQQSFDDMYDGYAPLNGTDYEEPHVKAYDEFIDFVGSDKSVSSSEGSINEETSSTLIAAQATNMEVDAQDAHAVIAPATIDPALDSGMYNTRATQNFMRDATLPTMQDITNSSAFQYNSNATELSYSTTNADAFNMPSPYPALPQFQPPSATSNSYGSPGYNMLLQQPFDPAQHLAQRLQTYVGGFNQMASAPASFNGSQFTQAPATNGHQGGGFGSAYGNSQQGGMASSAGVNGMGGTANNQAVFPPQAPQAVITGTSNNTAVTAAPAPVQHHVAGFIRDPALISEQACRAYLGHADVNDLKLIAIPNDDYAVVEQFREIEFTARLYNALFHAYSQTPSVTSLLATHYLNQQERAMSEVVKVLHTPTGSKRAKAQCYLLVRAAIHISTHGFDKKAHKGKQDDEARNHAICRDHHVDTKLICSERLFKLEEIIQKNKLVAKDVITGTNFARMCQDPAYYLEEKGKLLGSNARRAERTQQLSAMDGAPKGRKTKG